MALHDEDEVYLLAGTFGVVSQDMNKVPCCSCCCPPLSSQRLYLTAPGGELQRLCTGFRDVSTYESGCGTLIKPRKM